MHESIEHLNRAIYERVQVEDLILYMRHWAHIKMGLGALIGIVVTFLFCLNV
jgi:hypothetical protein